jgi:hypothetical protein
VSLREAKLPWASSMLNRRQWRSACTTVVSRNLDDVSVSLGNTAGNSSDTDGGNKFDRNTGALVDGMKIVDKLGKILQKASAICVSTVFSQNTVNL